MERTTFCLLFYIRRTKLNRNGEAPIMMRITVNGVRVDASVKKTILPEFWSAAKGKVLEKKRETILAEGVAERIIGLYALGNSTREISDWMEENLGNRVSAETISAITDRVLPEIKAWRSRSLESVYPIVWMDAIHYKVMDERGCAVTRAIYNVLALDSEGHKDLLGMYISKNEGANFWLNVLTDLQTRGVCDILIACVDGLKGFPDAIQSVFSDTIVQLCIFHQIRNSVKYVGSKHQKSS